MNKQKVSVIIPTLNRAQVLLDVLGDILKQKYPNFEVIVVDQTSKTQKDVLQFIDKNRAKIKYFHLLKKGSSYARNVGAKKAQGEIIIFLDDDIRINNPNFISYHISNFSDPHIAVVGGRVVEDFKMKDPHRKEVGKIKFFGLVDLPYFDATQRLEIDRAPGGNMSFRKEIFLKVGGYKEIYLGTAHLEETDFCLRVKRAGYKIMFDPRPVIKHLLYKTGGGRAKNLYEFRYWQIRNHIVFCLVNFAEIVSVLCAFQEGYWAVLSSLKRRDMKMFKSMFGAIIDGDKYYRSISGKRGVRGDSA